MIRGVCLASLLLCVFRIDSTEAATVCYSCIAAHTIAECTSAHPIFCRPDEKCHMSVSTPGGQMQYDLGCMTETQCPNSGSSPVIGRRQSTAMCSECCTGSLCNNKTCVQAVVGWSTWSNWQGCSVTCGIGMERRERTCSGSTCHGDFHDYRMCFSASCVDGGWSTWENWGSCPVSCGGGLRSRGRQCNNPKPSPLGSFCQGPSEQSEICNNVACHDEGQKDYFAAFDPTNHTGIFKQTMLRIGKAYNSNTGVFTCKRAGVYFFSMTLTVHQSTNSFFIKLKKNEGFIMDVQVGADTSIDAYASGSGSAFVHLALNDQVTLVASPSWRWNSLDYSTQYSGGLIAAD